MIGTNRKIETLIAIEKSKKQRYINRIKMELLPLPITYMHIAHYQKRWLDVNRCDCL